MYGSHKFDIFTRCLFEKYIYFEFKNKNTKKNLSARRILSLHIHHLICDVRELRIWNFLGALWKYVYFEFKNKNTKNNSSAMRIAALHIHPRICGVPDSQIWNSQGPVWKYVYFEFKNKNTKKKFNSQENLILAYSPPHPWCTRLTNLKFTRVLFESMSILNSKTKTPENNLSARSILSLHIHHLM